MGGQIRTPKLSLADAGGGTPSSDIVTTFALFLYCGFPYSALAYTAVYGNKWHPWPGVLAETGKGWSLQNTWEREDLINFY